MSARIWMVVAAVWMLSLMGVVTYTQAQAPAPPPQSSAPPNIITGQDIGFVIESDNRGMLTGRWMVRVRGQWRPVGGPGLVPLSR